MEAIKTLRALTSTAALALLSTLLGALAAPAQAACDPTQMCCKAVDIAGAPGCSGGGNPIDLITGNKYQREVDLPPLPGVLGLQVVRHYNSVNAHDSAHSASRQGPMGRGWRLGYEMELARLTPTRLQLTQPDGRPVQFTRGILDPRHYLAADPAEGDIVPREVAGSQGHVWHRLDGHEYSFDARGRLVQIAAPTGEFVSLQHDPSNGQLIKVTDPQGRSMSLHYARTGYVQSIDTPVGRIGYEHGPQGQLLKASYPANDKQHTERQYHHEDPRFPTLLTGITVEGTGSDGRPMRQRTSTWAYDHEGRATLSAKGPPARLQTAADGKPLQPYRLAEGTGIEQVVVLQRSPGKTVVLNGLGQKTEFRWGEVAGENKLLEVKGAGCAHCAGPNERYGYDKLGRLDETTRITEQGQPIETTKLELDLYGRTRSISRIAYLHGKPQAPQLLASYGYDGTNPKPSRISRPSVIAGREHVTRITYNEAGQPTSITEEGFSPIDEQGNPSPNGTPIKRTTTYAYSHINGRSVLTQIDGPLPNGPKNTPEDSDITRIEWDARADHVAALIRPMNLKQAFHYEAGAGRLSEVIAADGVVTRYEHAQALLNQPTLVERGGRRVRYGFDALGRVSEVADAPGRGISLRYDAADRLVAVVDAQGYKAQATLDTEGQARVAGLYEPNQAKPLRATYRWYDEQHRLTRELKADGRLDTWRYDEQGRVIEHIDGDDVLHLSRHNEASGAQALLDLAPDGLVRAQLSRPAPPAPQDSVALKRDDFGRTVAAWLPGQGTRQWRYDAADHPLQERRMDRSAQLAGTISYRYDAAGRQTQRVVLDPQGKAQATWRLRYEGARLAEDADGAQTLRYEYDLAGRIAGTAVELKDEQGRIVYRAVLGTEYDPQSAEPRRRRLADGSVMLIERGAAQTARRIGLRSEFWAGVGERLQRWLPGSWADRLEGWLPQQTIAADIGFHPYDGISGYTQGNGIKTGKHFDIAGRLQTLQVQGRGNLVADTLRYDVGPRIRGIDGADGKARYDYDGFGRLKPPAGPMTISTEGAQRIEQDRQGRAISDGRYRYTYTAQGQVQTVSTLDDKPVAKYRYNAHAQRVSKTVYEPQPHTTYYLWQQGKLVAEIEGSGEHQGEVTAQYLYLGDQGRAVPIAKLESAYAEGNQNHQARTLHIHSDHRGQPTAMTDERQQVMWRAEPDAWGYVKVSGQPQQAQLNLRLPGQYFDAETGLHDNWHRSYDARPGSANHGRYLSPDPLGYPDGTDAYSYVNGDPVNKVDPTGLYQEDIHYYMTFFLALAAGIDYDAARTIALAAQYVDDNPDTRPLDPKDPLNNIHNPDAIRRLLTYHFVLVSSTAGSDGLLDAKHYGDRPGITDIADPRSDQLTRLLTAIQKAPSHCAQYQFFGEYLHAFADTFAHRDAGNRPYGILDGIGHGLELSHPDYTYSDAPDYQGNDEIVLRNNWAVRPVRTLQMEKEMFAKMQTSYGTGTLAFEDIEATLKEFNATPENGAGPSDFARKIAVLQKRIDEWGLRDASGKKIDLLNEKSGGYDRGTGERNRNRNLCVDGVRLDQKDYPGTILPKSDVPCLEQKAQLN